MQSPEKAIQGQWNSTAPKECRLAPQPIHHARNIRKGKLALRLHYDADSPADGKEIAGGVRSEMLNLRFQRFGKLGTDAHQGSARLAAEEEPHRRQPFPDSLIVGMRNPRHIDAPEAVRPIHLLTRSEERRVGKE